MRRLLRRVIILTLLTLAALEMALSLIDPLGVAYVLQLFYINEFYAGPVEAGWLAPGQYDLGTWQIHILDDTTRRVPATGDGCRVVFFGDSVTFGWGVNDGDTFAAQLAQRWPSAHILNAGIPGYNSAQVRQRIDTIPHDVALYLVFDNDAIDFAIEGGNTVTGTDHHWPGFGLLHGQMSALAVYANYFTRRSGPPDGVSDTTRFTDDLTALVGQGVTLLAFDGGNSDWLAERYPVTSLPRYTTTVSAVDPHPDARAHAGIAQAIKDAIENPCQT